jgi:protein O-mannosyl-transferase
MTVMGGRDAPATRPLLQAAVVLAACAIYLNALGNGFAFDDVAIIQHNSRVHDLFGLRDIWLTPYWPDGAELGLWRPLAIFLYALQWAAGGGSPIVFHAVNIALHGVVTLLVFLLLERLTAAVPAFWGALIFAVHPVHTEVVANVVGQAELVAAAASLLACLIVARRPPGAAVTLRQSVLITGCFLAAVLSKEHAVVLPALLVLIDLAQRRIGLSATGIVQYARGVALPVALLMAALGGYLAVRFHVLDGALLGVQAGPQLHYLHGDLRLLNALRAFPELLRLLFFPASLAADYSPAVILPVEGVTGMVLIGGVVLAACVLLAALTPWRPALGLPAAWFLVTILTVSNLFFAVGVLLAERTLYLPSVAVSAAVACGWFYTRYRWSRQGRLALGMVLLAASAAGAYRSWIRNPDWLSTAAVQHALMRDHPQSYKAQWVHATLNGRLGNIELARSHFRLAVRIYPYDSDLLTEFGGFLLKHGDREEAMRVLREARRLHPRRPTAVFLLGTALLEAGSYREALALGLQAVDDGVDGSAALPIVAAAHFDLGERDAAIATWRQLIREAELPSMYWAQLALALSTHGAPDDARAALRKGQAAADHDESARVLLLEAEQRIRAAGTEPAPAPSVPPPR